MPPVPALKEPTVHYERASAALLAQTPNEPANYDPRPEDGWLELVNHCTTRMAMMTTWRWSWWTHWALLAQYLLPRRNLWLTENAGSSPVPNSMVRGMPINQSIVDPTGSQAANVCANGMMAGLTSPSRPWFKLTPGLANGIEIDRDAQIWLDEVENRMYDVMSGSNLYESLATMFLDLVVYGTAPIIVYEDERDLIRCYNPCAGEYFLAVSPALRVESVYRQFVFTIAQIVEMFGLENCPPSVQGMWRTKGGSLEVERVVAHAIEPNFPINNNGIMMRPLKGDFAWREVYWLWGEADARPLSVRGFKESPAFAPRWVAASNDPYGRSPGMDALPDILQLQTETKRKAEAIEKTVRPPLLAAAELKNQPSSILPGHITYVANLGPQSGMRSIYDVKFDLNDMTQDIGMIQQRIQRGFFNDLFLMLSQATKDMTAFEVAQRMQEKLQVLGPVIERLQNEALSPLIKRVFGIMARKRLLPPLPPSLKGVPLQIEYISMLALAQKAAATAGIERLMGFVGNLEAVTQQGPTPALDNIDTDWLIHNYSELLGNNHKIFNSKEKIAEMRQGRAQAQQAALQQKQASEAVKGIAQPAVEAAQTLAQTDTGNGVSALQRMIGGGGGQ